MSPLSYLQTDARLFARQLTRLALYLAICAAAFLMAAPAQAQESPPAWPPGPEPPVLPLEIDPYAPSSGHVLSANAEARARIAPFASWTRMVYLSAIDGTPDLYVVMLDGSDWRRITNNAAVEARAALFPDGERMVFDADYDGDGKRELWLSDLRGGLRRLTDTDANDYDAAASPDGSLIAFVSDRDGNPELYVLTLATGQQVRMTSNPLADYEPIWHTELNAIFYAQQVTAENAAFASVGYPPGSPAPAFGSDDFHLPVALRTLHIDAFGGSIAYSFESEDPIGLSSGVRAYSRSPASHYPQYRPPRFGFFGYYIDELIPFGFDPIITRLDQREPLLLLNQRSYYTRGGYGTRVKVYTGNRIAITDEFRFTTLFDNPPGIALSISSVDNTPPYVVLSRTESPSRSGQRIEAAAVDTQAGIDYYTIVHRVEPDGLWMWEERTRTPPIAQSFFGTHLFNIRVKVRDLAGNETFTPPLYLETYVKRIAGRVYDVRGEPVAAAGLTLQAHYNWESDIPLTTFTDALGRYMFQVPQFHPAQGNPWKLGLYFFGMPEHPEQVRLLQGTLMPEQPVDPPNYYITSPVLAAAPELLGTGSFEPTTPYTNSWRLRGQAVVDARLPTLYLTSYYSEMAFDGGRHLLLRQPASSASISVTIPVALRNPTLSLQWKGEGSPPLAELSGADFTTPLALQQGPALGFGWWLAWADLSAYAGQSVTLTLRSPADTPPTGLFVDGVRVSPWLTPLLDDIAAISAAAEGDGASAPDRSLTLTGANLVAPLKVEIGRDEALTPLSVTPVDEGTVRVALPALAPGLYRVRITTNVGGDQEWVTERNGALQVGYPVYLPMTSMY